MTQTRPDDRLGVPERPTGPQRLARDKLASESPGGNTRLTPCAGMISLCQLGKSGESHVRRSLRRRDRGLYRQSDQLLNGYDGL